jgi:crotonobetaine/carnitine-CoA ligase
VLSDHPNIVEMAVIAVPDPIRDEAVKAFVVLDEPDALTEEDIIDYCKEHLADFKVPTIIEFRESLPKTSIGKVEKKVLRAEEAERAEEEEKVSTESRR